MAERLHEIIYAPEDKTREVMRVLIPRWNWTRKDGRPFLVYSACPTDWSDITDLLTGTTPKFAISEDE